MALRKEKIDFFFRCFLPRYLPRFLRRRWEILQKKQGRLEDLYVFLTNQCNARCRHCFFIEELGYVPGELRLEEYRQIAATLPQLERIFFTGGEALLHPECSDIVRLMGKATRASRVGLITNGLLPDRVEKFVRSVLGDPSFPSLLDILVSLDGLEETHNDVRQNPHAWERANETLARLEQLRDEFSGRLESGVITIITSRNWQEIEALADHIDAHYPRTRQGFEIVRGTNFSLWGLAPQYRADFNPPEEVLPPPSAWNEILKMLERVNRRRGIAHHAFHITTLFTIEMLRTGKKLVDCVSAGQNVAVLYSTGDLAVCEFSQPFGNIRDYGLNFDRAWHSAEADTMRRATSRCWCTHGCYLSKNIEYSLAGLWAMLRKL